MCGFGMLLMAASAVLLAAEIKGQNGSCPSAGTPTPTSSCVTCSAQPGCANVTTAPFFIKDAIYRSSPFYEAASTTNILYDNIDNVCNTFFEIDGCSFLLLRCIVPRYGNCIIQKYIIADILEFPGSYRLQGLFTESGCSSFVDQQCVLGQACNDTFVVYRCNRYKGTDAIILPDTDNRIVFSKNRTLTPYCYERAISIANSQKFNYYEFAQAPNQRPARCVTWLNGMRCINYQNVAPGDQISLPPQPCA